MKQAGQQLTKKVDMNANNRGGSSHICGQNLEYQPFVCWLAWIWVIWMKNQPFVRGIACFSLKLGNLVDFNEQRADIVNKKERNQPSSESRLLGFVFTSPLQGPPYRFWHGGDKGPGGGGYMCVIRKKMNRILLQGYIP